VTASLAPRIGIVSALSARAQQVRPSLRQRLCERPLGNSAQRRAWLGRRVDEGTDARRGWREMNCPFTGTLINVKDRGAKAAVLRGCRAS
jgi:hypothetical protein